jgi:hypothetical protein
MSDERRDHSARFSHDASRNDRNDSLEFARRTRRNLEAIEAARRNNVDVYPVTQLTLSLLGLVVFPWARQFDESVKSLSLQALFREGWPEWNFMKGTSATLSDLMFHLRNAVAHRRVHFSSDSPDPKHVTIQFSDAKPKHADTYWTAEISAEDLRLFCVKFIELVDDRLR